MPESQHLLSRGKHQLRLVMRTVGVGPRLRQDRRRLPRLQYPADLAQLVNRVRVADKSVALATSDAGDFRF